MKIRVLILLIVAVSSQWSVAQGRVNSTRKGLQLNVSAKEKIDNVIDTIVIKKVDGFCENAVTMRGYAKSAGAAKETFMLTNNTNLWLSLVEFTFRYTDVDGVQVHERTETISCDLPPYSSRQVSIKSFDVGKKFYYYKNKPRKDAVAYKVAIKLLRYDIKVARD